MQLLIFIFLIPYYYSNTINDTEIDLEIINIKKYEFKKTNLHNAGICLEIKELDNNEISYLSFQSNVGSINKTLKYEFINDNDCYINYTYNLVNNSLKSIEMFRTSSYNEGFNYEYQFMKEENANYIFVIYTDYNGTELTITHLKMQSTTISFVFLGILGGFIILLICVCFCWYKFCKKKQKKELDGQYQSVFLGLEYKNTIDI
jgi:hypothetical protein